jgi:hypothetical protein
LPHIKSHVFKDNPFNPVPFIHPTKMDRTSSPYSSDEYDDDDGELTGEEPIFREEETKKVANRMMEKSGPTTSIATVTQTTTIGSKKGGEGGHICFVQFRFYYFNTYWEFGQVPNLGVIGPIVGEIGEEQKTMKPTKELQQAKEHEGPVATDDDRCQRMVYIA